MKVTKIKQQLKQQAEQSAQIIGIMWFRIALFFVAVGFPLVGVFNNMYLEHFNDPLLPRIILGFLCFVLLIGTYIHPIFIKHFFKFLTLILFLVFIGSYILCYINETSIIGVSLFLISMAIVSMALRNSKSVLIFNIIAFAVSILLFLNYRITYFERIFILIIIFLLLFISYVISRIRNIADNKLAESERRYRLLAENITDVIWVFDVKTMHFKYISPSIENLTGFSATETVLMKVSEIFAPESVDLLTGGFKKSIRNFLKHPELNHVDCHQLQQKCKNGNFLWVELTTRFHKAQNGKIEILGVTRNIDSRKKTELELQKFATELQRTNRDKDRLLSILAHDLRSPFNTILGFSTLLQKNAGIYTAEKIADQAGIINKTALNAYELLDDLLLWGKTQTGKLNFVPEELDLHKLCAEVIDSFKSTAHFKEISLMNNLPNNFTAIADKFMVKTIIRNLISNAIKFTPQGGTVIIKADNIPEFIAVSVHDTGVGISSENIAKIWNMATEYTTKGTNNEPGTGLGLLICKELVEKTGGYITVHSELGKGSVFTFTLSK